MSDKNHISDKYFKNITSPLLTKKGFALFQIALISKDSCIENTKHFYNRPLICTTFKNSIKVENALNKIKYKKPYYIEFKTKELGIDDSQSREYLIKQLKYTKKWLVAKNNLFLYKNSTDLSNFLHFIKYRYIPSNGIGKIWEKGQNLFIIIFGVSFSLLLLLKWIENKNLQKYEKGKKERYDIQKKIQELEKKSERSKENYYNIRKEIRAEERYSSHKNKIVKLEKEEKRYKEEINDNKEKMKKLKEELESKNLLLLSKGLKLSTYYKDKEYIAKSLNKTTSKPHELSTLLSRFSSDEKLKYSNHTWDNSLNYNRHSSPL
jgi:hypothetical protein